MSPARVRADVLLPLAPFVVATGIGLALLAKPFHIDDANFVMFARQLAQHPLRPFAAGAVHSNPPGNQYLLAALSWLGGESEAVLHLGLLPFALLALWGLHRLAMRFCVRPAWLPGLLVACSPCFLLSATSLMPDVTMLGFLLPAMALLFDDEVSPHPLRLLGATVLFAVGWTLRFNGLPPLALAALLALSRGHRRALGPLLALVGTFVFWTWLSHVQLGAPQTLSPLIVAGSPGSYGVLLLKRVLNAASAFMLVCAVGPALLLLRPALGARRWLELLAFGAFALCTLLPGPTWPLVGVALLCAAWLRLPRAGELPGLDKDTLFLLAWAASGLLVPIVYNQSAAKYLNLPQIPLLLLLLRGDALGVLENRVRSGLVAAAILLAVSVPLLSADLRHATLLRGLTREQVARARESGAVHTYVAGTPWGLLVYARDAGATYFGGSVGPDTAEAHALKPGDQLVDLSWPGMLALPPEGLELLEERVANDAFPIRLMSGGAGYWSSDWGVAPFVFSHEPYARSWRVRVLPPVASPR